MRLDLGRRIKNQLRRTQFEFNIVVWELFGRSELLSEMFGTDVFITFSLTPRITRESFEAGQCKSDVFHTHYE